MFLDPGFFGPGFLAALAMLTGALLLFAVVRAPWRAFIRARLSHVFFGAILVLMLLWQMSAEIMPGVAYHLLGLTVLTLTFGWALALIAAALAQLAVVLNGAMTWDALALNWLLAGALPILLTQSMLYFVSATMPKNVFVYVLVNAFLAAGVAGVCMGYCAVWLLLRAGAFDAAALQHNLVAYFPLMFMPEAMLNGWIAAVLVVFRPQWVRSFSDDVYLKGK